MSGSDGPREGRPPRPGGRGVVGLPAQRERAVKILSECFARNALEMEEFERRVALAHQAGSVQELARLIEDIPGELLETPEEPAVSTSARAPALREGEQSLYGIMMSRTCRGRWLKARTLNTRTLMSSIHLDFRDLELSSEVVEINVLALMSSIVITVPAELPVQLEVVPILGEAKEGRGVRSGLSGRGPGVRITGFIMMGDIKVRVR
jgi:hypothetical protein